MKSVQHISERRIKLDRRRYKKRQDLIMRGIKNGGGRLTEYVKGKRERI
jgi:hypothetical protein